ncbi:MAG: hypothetical protein NUW09_01640 [Deltaproteobacteria bacterium]|nr:hypothetical protein [Deltaproteobacteria bacterium]
MRKTFLLPLLLIFLSGCGPSLQELMITSPTTKVVEKSNAFCVYNKLHMLTLSDEPGYHWSSGWDPSIEKGELIRTMNNGSTNLSAFNIHRMGNNTVIELRTASQYGIQPSGYFSKNKHLAEQILSSADFSGCPDYQELQISPTSP